MAETMEQEKLDEALQEYINLQQQERDIRARKKELQQELFDGLADEKGEYWYGQCKDQPVKVLHREKTIYEFDEELLAKRLKGRYRYILSPNMAKMRRNMGEIRKALLPHIEKIGSPDPYRINWSIENGHLTKEEMEGTYKQVKRLQVSVSCVNNRDDKAPASSAKMLS